MKIILASKSQRRRSILSGLGLHFEVMPSNADESKIEDENPRELVKRLAKLKAMTIAKGLREHVIVIGADTIVYFEGNVIGKPTSPNNAKEILSKLSGKEHDVLTGICIINTKSGNVYTDVQRTRVKFRDLVERDIERCVEFKGTLTGCGAYVPETQPILIKSIEGSYTNINGIPTEKLIPMLRENGIDI